MNALYYGDNPGVLRQHLAVLLAVALVPILSAGCASREVTASHIRAFQKTQTVRLIEKGEWRDGPRKIDAVSADRERVVASARTTLEAAGIRVVGAADPADGTVTINYGYYRLYRPVMKQTGWIIEKERLTGDIKSKTPNLVPTGQETFTGTFFSCDTYVSLPGAKTLWIARSATAPEGDSKTAFDQSGFKQGFADALRQASGQK